MTIDCVSIDYFSTAKKDPLQKVSPENISMKQFARKMNVK